MKLQQNNSDTESPHERGADATSGLNQWGSAIACDTDNGGTAIAERHQLASLDELTSCSEAVEVDFSVLNSIAELARDIHPESLGLNGDFSFLTEPDLSDIGAYDPRHVFIEHYCEYRAYLTALEATLKDGERDCGGDARFRRSGQEDQSNRNLGVSIDLVQAFREQIEIIRGQCQRDFFTFSRGDPS